MQVDGYGIEKDENGVLEINYNKKEKNKNQNKLNVKQGTKEKEVQKTSFEQEKEVDAMQKAEPELRDRIKYNISQEKQREVVEEFLEKQKNLRQENELANSQIQEKQGNEKGNEIED